jgi:Ca2+/Na+ antiporter
MALGAAIPSIVLSIIQLSAINYDYGEVGARMMVGASAFNVFIIISYCVIAVPIGEIRKIEKLTVLFVTFLWMIFAYIWLCLVIIVISPGVIELWEAIVTLIFYPLSVINAYLVDKKLHMSLFNRMNLRLKSDEYDLSKKSSQTVLSNESTTSIVILNENHGGEFLFKESKLNVFENIGSISIKVTRVKGSKGRVKIPFQTVDDTTIAGKDYIEKHGYIIFDQNETEFVLFLIIFLFKNYII